MANYFVNAHCGYSPITPHTAYIWREVCKHEFVTDEQVEAISERYALETGEENPMGHERMASWMNTRKRPLLLLRAGETPRKKRAARRPKVMGKQPVTHATVEELFEQVLELMAKIEEKL
jgi:hypothetical protein